MILRLVGKNKRVLDYGAGTGDFLNALKGAGFTVVGVEPSAQAREHALQTLRIELSSSIETLNIKPETLNCITMWHVLEHVHRLDETLEALKNLLTPAGVMLVAVPNADSYDASVYKEFWAAYDVPRHLYHFNQSSMTMLLEKHGMRVEKVMPMVFDSFYVSMLSEKYKGRDGGRGTRGEGRGERSRMELGFFKAFFTGLWSNIKGTGDKKYFSSLIYVVRRREGA